MEKRDFYRTFTLIIAFIITISCVKKDDFEVPLTEIVSTNIDLSSVIEVSAPSDVMMQEQTNTGNPHAVLTFEETNKYISGYVISSDGGGNFFEELLLQNSTAN